MTLSIRRGVRSWRDRDLVRAARRWPRLHLSALVEIVRRIEAGTPFGFARYGDGEMNAIAGTATSVSRDAQQVTREVADVLRVGLSSPADGVILGIPCPACWPVNHVDARRIAPGDAELVPATALQNASHVVASRAMLGVLREQKDRNVVWVGADGHNVAALEESVGRPISTWRVPGLEGFSAAIERIRASSSGLPEGSVVLLSCGPASRPGVSLIRTLNPSASAIGVGSLFDPLTRDTRHAYHRMDSARVCPACAGPVHRKQWNAVHESLTPG